MGQDAKFTAGPWVAREYNIYADEIQIVANDGVYVASVDVDGQQGMAAWSEIQADAHLIAAAPEMYEALIAARKHIVDGFRNICHDFPESRMAGVTQIDAAIAKARGEQ